MLRLALAMGAKVETLSGLSGLGDLSLTCMSENSRNFRYGLALGRGKGFDSNITVEGVATAHGISNGTTDIADAMKKLMNRPQKEE